MSSSEQKRLRKALDRAEKAAESLGVSESRTRRSTATTVQLNRTLGINIISLAVVVMIVWAATVVLGVPVNGFGVALLFVLAIGISLATNRVGSFSFGFWAVTLGLSAVIVDYLVPSAIVDLFAPVTAFMTDIPGVSELLAIPSLQLLGLTIGVVSVYYLLDIRVLTALYRQSGQPEAANADTVARAFVGRVENLFEDYVQVGVAVGILAFSLTVILLSGIGDFGAQVFEVAGEVPVLTAGLVNWATGYVALGGTVPVLADLPVVGWLFAAVLDALASMGPVGFALFGGAVLLLGWFAWRNQD